MLTSIAIKRKALELGFDACGIAPADAHPELQFFREWLESRIRRDDGAICIAAPSDAVTSVASSPPRRRSLRRRPSITRTGPYSLGSADPAVAQIARYAWGEDYHEVIGVRLERLLDWMRRARPEPFEARAYVDTGPVQERVYAQIRRARMDWEEHLRDQPRPRDRGSFSARSSAVCRSTRIPRLSISAARARSAWKPVRPARSWRPGCSTPRGASRISRSSFAARYRMRSGLPSARTSMAATCARKSVHGTRPLHDPMIRRGNHGRRGTGRG